MTERIDTLCQLFVLISFVNLPGKWRRETGFDTGQPVTVRIVEGCLILTPGG